VFNGQREEVGNPTREENKKKKNKSNQYTHFEIDIF
jgi:hypothetical protein